MTQLTTNVPYTELTVDQAEFVNRAWPNDDPWKYVYVILAGAVIDRYQAVRA